jgi:hypothetical protein
MPEPTIEERERTAIDMLDHLAKQMAEAREHAEAVISSTAELLREIRGDPPELTLIQGGFSSHGGKVCLPRMGNGVEMSENLQTEVEVRESEGGETNA